MKEMTDLKGERPLTDEDKSLIRETIARKTTPDDRDPSIVIKEVYGGDEETYLRVMARQHGIPIGSSQKNKGA